MEAGRATYTGTLRERLAAFSPDLAAGFHVGNLDDVSRATNALRAKLEGELTPRQRPHNTQR